MKEVIEITAQEIAPSQKDSFALQGISFGAKVSDNIISLFEHAAKIFMACANPTGLVSDISKDDFQLVYKGEGRNDPDTPVAEVFHKADKLALFAVTVGQEVHDRINEYFLGKDFALGSMLDSVASAGVEKTADRVETYFLDTLRRSGGIGGNALVMRYSPGYCGWHVSGQKRLFEYLKPEQIGITLRASYLMEPLKSASGVLITGSPEIHSFTDAYPFCSQCETRSCRERISRLRQSSGTGDVRTRPAPAKKHRRE